ncbi:MAG: adenylosuccinate lyase, partial [Candidatus Ranarchaeia archaeon]
MALLEKRIIRLIRVLVSQAEENKQRVCIGRTHGQHAIPTTYGMKFMRWAVEMERHLHRLDQLRGRLLKAKLSGAVGTMASLGEKGFRVQTSFALYLRLEPVDIASQVVPRDSYAEYIMWCSLVAATLETIAKEIRNLQRTEIMEIAEPFASTQVGSSTMAHKRNPHKSERICGLARIIRGYINPAVENIALEHERDLTNSSPERILFPSASILLDYLLVQSATIIQGLDFFPENIDRNLNLTHGLANTEHVMLELTRRGMSRQTAHEILRKAGIRARETNTELLSLLLQDERITKIASEKDIKNWLDPANYIGTAIEQVSNLSQRIRKHLEVREKK